MPYPTGDTVSSGFVALTFYIPPDPWIASALMGAIIPMAYPNQWSDDGDILPSTAAAIVQYAWTHFLIGPTMLAQIVCFPLDNYDHVNHDPAQPLNQWRKCDGQALLKTDFPDLFALIGSTFGGDTTHFNLPDLRGRTIVDAGSGPGLTSRALAASFGEENHVYALIALSALCKFSTSTPGSCAELRTAALSLKSACGAMS